MGVLIFWVNFIVTWTLTSSFGSLGVMLHQHHRHLVDKLQVFGDEKYMWNYDQLHGVFKKIHFCICSDAGASQTAADLFGDDDMEVRLRLLCFRLDGSTVDGSEQYFIYEVVVSNILFLPLPGEMIQFDWRIFFKWVGSTTNYCWWFRNLANHLGFCENPVNNGINYLSTINWLAGFHPSTVAYLTLSVSMWILEGTTRPPQTGMDVCPGGWMVTGFVLDRGYPIFSLKNSPFPEPNLKATEIRLRASFFTKNLRSSFRKWNHFHMKPRWLWHNFPARHWLIVMWLVMMGPWLALKTKSPVLWEVTSWRSVYPPWKLTSPLKSGTIFQ